MCPTKITLGEMREGRDGPRRILVYCADYRCSHSMAMSADQWPDDVRLSDIEPAMVCKVCGKRDADVRPHFKPAKMGYRAKSKSPASFEAGPLRTPSLVQVGNQVDAAADSNHCRNSPQQYDWHCSLLILFPCHTTNFSSATRVPGNLHSGNHVLAAPHSAARRTT